VTRVKFGDGAMRLTISPAVRKRLKEARVARPAQGLSVALQQCSGHFGRAVEFEPRVELGPPECNRSFVLWT